MKASPGWMLVLAVALAAWTSCQGQGHGVMLTEQQVTDTTLTPPAAGHVNVLARCANLAATVNPPRQQVPRHTSVEWQLTGADSQRIAPKDPANWPFANARPTGTNKTPASSGAMKEPAPVEGTLIKYAMTIYCGQSPIGVDPELIITAPDTGFVPQ